MSELSFSNIEPPPIQKRDIESTTLKFLLAAAVFSVLFHVATLTFFSRIPQFNRQTEQAANSIPVEFVNPSQFKDAVETMQEKAEDAPKDSKFVSEKNLKAEEDTSPESAPTQAPHRGGPKSQSKAQAQKEKSSDTLFSLKQKDLLQEAQKEEATLAPGGDGLLSSTGFYERLKKGQEFKVSATESDYAQYITRMKNKLIDRWSPQKLIRAAWSQFSEVRVDIAVVLDRQGEIVALKIVGNSSFQDFDQEALRALRESGPFPNPPKSLIQDDGHVYMPWSFALYMRGWGMAGAPSRGVE